jgi:hypothetical protein
MQRSCEEGRGTVLTAPDVMESSVGGGGGDGMNSSNP